MKEKVMAFGVHRQKQSLIDSLLLSEVYCCWGSSRDFYILKHSTS